MRKNEPESFVNEMIGKSDVAFYKLIKVDAKRGIKAISLATGLISLAIGLPSKLAKYMQNLQITIEPVNIIWPQIPLEDVSLIFGLVALIPFLSITFYDRFSKKEGVKIHEIGDNGNYK